MSIFLTLLTLIGFIVIPYLVGKYLDLLAIHSDESILGTWVFGFAMSLFILVIVIFLVRGLSDINKYYESIL